MKEFFDKIRLLLHSIFVIANIVAGVLLILSAYSDHISPEKSIIFSYLGLAFPILFAINVGLVIYWLIFRWKLVLIPLLTFVITSGAIRQYFPWHSHTKPIPEENVVKVLTYNVMKFAYQDHTKEAPNQIVQYIAESDANIVCLQEYVVFKNKKNTLTSAKLYEALKMYPYRSVILIESNQTQDYGIAVFSKYPISKSKAIPYESRNNGSSIHEINVNGKKITLVNNHLESFKLTMEDRSRYSAFIKNLNADTFDEFKSAISHKLEPAFRTRVRQAEAVANEVNNSRNEYILVCGDFNDTPISYVHRTIQKAADGLKDAFTESGQGMGITYNENFFWFRIDHILYSPNMKAWNCTVDHVRYSDHYPVWCYLEIE
ncbi:MAG: endonuclease/exonuclease/phosphatase family protein [Tannerellaceae bacterium]|nr:endonuclease/exonuclease/phosphatase family protein [Tannerellaceae bacterium]